jgi:hypothetical protein
MLKSEWQEYFIPFDTLEQTGWGLDVGQFDPSLIFTLQFQVDLSTDFDLWVDDVSYYTDEDRELAEAMPDAGTLDAGANASDASIEDGATDALDAAPPVSSELDAATSETTTMASDTAPNDTGPNDTAPNDTAPNDTASASSDASSQRVDAGDAAP